MSCLISTPKTTAAAVFTPSEREYTRRELDWFFSTLLNVADGFQLRTWRGGAQAGQPKVPLVAKGLLKRGLMRFVPTPWPPRLFFTEAEPVVACNRAARIRHRFEGKSQLPQGRQRCCTLQPRRSRLRACTARP